MLGFGPIGAAPLGSIDFEGISTNTLARTSRLLQDVVTELVCAGTLTKLPKRLHHFTTLDTAHLIITFDNLRLSHALYSNDHQELEWSRSVIRDALNARMPDPFFRDVEAAYIARLSSIDAYVFCMSSDRDLTPHQDILSQWRAYGQDGRGACLTLDAWQLSSLVRNTPALRINPVIYEPEVQQRLINSILSGGMALNSTVRNAVEITVAALIFAMPLMKAVGFSEEKEWRLIFMPPNDSVSPDLGFMARRDLLTPYVDLNYLWNKLRPEMLKVIELRGLLKDPFPDPPKLVVPLLELMVGPSGHQELNKKAFDKLLRQKGRLVH